MFRSPKSLLVPVWRWLDGDIEEDRVSWDLQEGSDHGIATLTGAPFKAWSEWRRGLLPRDGGWQDQPLLLLILMEAIDLMVNTHRIMRSENADWKELSKTQRAIVSWTGVEVG